MTLLLQHSFICNANNPKPIMDLLTEYLAADLEDEFEDMQEDSVSISRNWNEFNFNA